MMDADEQEPLSGVETLQNEETTIVWVEDTFVWDLTELEIINKDRKAEGLEQIEIVKKHLDVDLGIRAHPDMNAARSLKSIFIPHQNEFMFIWLFLGFSVYFWVEVGFLATKDSSFAFT